MGGGPRPAARTPPAVLGLSSGGTAAPRPLRDAIPRPDSRPSALAATEQQRLPLGAAVAAASSCSSFSGAAAYTHSRCTPMLSPSNRAHAPRLRHRPPSLLAPLSELSLRPRKVRKSTFPRAQIERCQSRGGRSKWHPTPVFLHRESRGQRSLLGCCPWGHTESDTTEAT